MSNLKWIARRALLELDGLTASVIEKILVDEQLVEHNLPRTVAEAAPEAAAPVSRRWTPELLAEMRTCKDAHGTLAASKKYGVSPARIRALSPSGKTRPKAFSVFTHHVK